MLTFLELYQTLLGFVFFKLYTDINLVYPPKLDDILDENGAGIGALLLEETGKGLVVVRDESAEDQEKKRVYAKDVRKQIHAIGLNGNDAAEAAAVAEDEAMVTLPAASDDPVDLDVFESLATNDLQLATSTTPTLFTGYFFYLSREVTRPTLEFVIRSFGGQVGWDAVLGAGSPFLENDARITHHIVDRPVVPGAAPREHPGKRAYIQPQWVVDCINRGTLLPTDEYRPGATLPPHLSPFVDEDEVRSRGGYVPMEAKRIEDVEMAEGGEEEEDSDDDDEDNEEEEIEEVVPKGKKGKKVAAALLAAAKDPKNEALLHAAELDAESRGIAPAQFAADLAAETKKAKKAAGGGATKGAPKKVDRSQEEQLASIMLTGKQKKVRTPPCLFYSWIPVLMFWIFFHLQLYKKMAYSQDRKAEDVRGVPSFSRKATLLTFFPLSLLRRPSSRVGGRRSRRRRRRRPSRPLCRISAVPLLLHCTRVFLALPESFLQGGSECALDVFFSSFGCRKGSSVQPSQTGFPPVLNI